MLLVLMTSGWKEARERTTVVEKEKCCLFCPY